MSQISLGLSNEKNDSSNERNAKSLLEQNPRFHPMTLKSCLTKLHISKSYL